MKKMQAPSSSVYNITAKNTITPSGGIVRHIQRCEDRALRTAKKQTKNQLGCELSVRFLNHMLGPKLYSNDASDPKTYSFEGVTRA